jgi:putative sterol carrier protein
MTDPRITKILERGAPLIEAVGLRDRVVLDFGTKGTVLVDGAQRAISFHHEAGEADARLAMSLDDFERLVKRELDPTKALLMGRLKVKGDIGLLLKLAEQARGSFS